LNKDSTKLKVGQLKFGEIEEGGNFEGAAGIKLIL
jgi:hypothetical protein